MLLIIIYRVSKRVYIWLNENTLQVYDVKRLNEISENTGL